MAFKALPRFLVLLHLFITIRGQLVNVLINGTATQSSTEYGGKASRAIDGNSDPIWGGSSCTHTHQGDMQPWWRVKLAQKSTISSVTIVNRATTQKRISCIDIRIGSNANHTQNPLCASWDYRQAAVQFGDVRNFNCSRQMYGEYLSIEKTCIDYGPYVENDGWVDGKPEVISYCEIQALGTNSVYEFSEYQKFYCWEDLGLPWCRFEVGKRNASEGDPAAEMPAASADDCAVRTANKEASQFFSFDENDKYCVIY